MFFFSLKDFRLIFIFLQETHAVMSDLAFWKNLLGIDK